MNTSVGTFKFKIFLPSKQKYYKFREFNNFEYLNVVKAITNDDNEQLYGMLKDIIKFTSHDKNDLDTLTKVDKFCVLLNLYILCVSDTLELRSGKQDAGMGKIKVSLYDILDKVTNFEFEYTKNIKINKNVSLTLTTPADLYTDDPEDIIVNCIKDVRIMGKTHSFNDLTTKQKHQALESISSDVTTKLISSMKEVNDQYQLDVLKYGESEDKIITLNIYNNSMYELLKIIYNTNLQTQYYYRYFAAKHMKFNNEYVENITPAELQTYVKFFQKEQDEIEEQRKKAQKGSGGQHLGAPIG